MNCREFEYLWNERIDAAGARSKNHAPDSFELTTLSETETAIDAHAGTCSACAVIDARYRKLLAALERLSAPPDASAGFLARLHQAAGAPKPEVYVRNGRTAWLLTAAAAVLAIGLTLSVVRPWSRAKLVDDQNLVAKADAPRPLSASIVEATSATLDFARETSAPAGRVGREVFASASLPDAESPLSLEMPSAPSAELLESVGHRVGAAAKPLSGSARQAFGFLIRATTGEPTDVPSATPPRGT